MPMWLCRFWNRARAAEWDGTDSGASGPGAQHCDTTHTM